MGASENTSSEYVQIPELELSKLRIEHLTSAIDMSIGLPERLAHLSAETVSGYTEWVGCWRGADVSIGWDWGVVRGEVILLNAGEIRTNIQLFAADGVPMSALLTRAYLGRWLETVPWREGPIRDLIQRNGQRPS